MIKPVRLLTALALLLIATTLVAAELPAVGSDAPAFSLLNEKGEKTSLESLRGRWVVLYFYPKDFTSGCTMQARGFQRDLAKYQERGSVIVGVSVDSAESHKDFCAKEGLNFTLLADTDGSVSQAYGSTMQFGGKTLSARNTFVIDPKGKIAQVFPAVKPAGHSDEVLAAIDELRAQK